VLARAEDLDPSLLRRGQDLLDDVQVAVIGRAGVLEDRVAVVPRVRTSVVPAVKEGLIGGLYAVVRERLARDLAAGQATPVGERRQVDRVDPTTLLEGVEHLLDPFVDERDGTHLDADDPVPGRWNVLGRPGLFRVHRG